MRLRIRTLGSEECEVEIQPDDSILTLKKKVEEKLPRMTAQKQKLVHAGKVLEDRLLVKNYPALKENERLVVLVSKNALSPWTVLCMVPSGTSTFSMDDALLAQTSTSTSSASTETATPSASASAPRSADGITGAEKSTLNQPASDAPSSGAPPAENASAGTAAEGSTADPSRAAPSIVNESTSMIANGPQLEEMHAQLEAMGFPSDQVRVALRAAFNNPDRAVEYLMNGIPPNLVESNTISQTGQETPGSDHPLAALRTHPTFLQVRQLVQANPQVLPAVLQMIGNTNPNLLELINQNQDAFLEMLQEGDPADEGAEGGLSSAEAAADAAGVGAGGGVISLTGEEMAAVERLMTLGFSRMQVAEAYLACDRNEEMAANYLIENMNDFAPEDSEEPRPS